MVLFPHCKINLGLRVLRRREDGYHDIQTVMYPVRGLCDSVEMVRGGEEGRRGERDGERLLGTGRQDGARVGWVAGKRNGTTSACAAQAEGRGEAHVSLACQCNAHFSASGLAVDCPPEKNICIRAYGLMRERYGIGPVDMHLHKAVPTGAGLGGGSADGTFVLCGLNELFGLRLGVEQLEALAAELGSDTAFFVRDTPAICTGRGEIITPCAIPALEGKWLLIVKPPVAISTGEAYAGLTPDPATPLESVVSQDISSWRGELKNDFETTIFPKHPLLAQIKKQLYEHNALYASMSGSGAALYGIFASRPATTLFPPEFFTHCEELTAK